MANIKRNKADAFDVFVDKMDEVFAINDLLYVS
jgi:hypothetical protein